MQVVEKTLDPDVSPDLLAYFSWPTYCLEHTYPPVLNPEKVEAGSMIGSRWGVFPLYFEEYFGETEPILSKDTAAPFRFVGWHRIQRSDTPAPWWRWPLERSDTFKAYDILKPDYYRTWSQTARRRRSFWLRELQGVKYNIVPLTFEMFANAYSKSTVAQEEPTFELHKLSNRLTQYPEHISVWGVERVKDGTICAGLAVVYSPDFKGTYYSCSFYLPEVRKDGLMVGLIDHWCTDALKKGSVVFHMGGCVPDSFMYLKRSRDISAFKLQFATRTFRFDSLYRFVRGKLLR